ncbi:MAG: hypothetical protein RR576_10510 [Oscillospiraceae bacterium]
MSKAKRFPRVITFALTVMMVFALAVPTFAAPPIAEKANGAIATSSAVQPRTNTGVQKFQLSGYSLYLNIRNTGHSGAAYSGDSVILWSYVSTNDQKWNVTYASSGYYFRHGLNNNLALNVNHAQNMCTLYSPVNNFTNGKNDSDIYMNGNKLQLSDWGSQLTYSIPQADYAGYWTSAGSGFVASGA